MQRKQLSCSEMLHMLEQESRSRNVMSSGLTLGYDAYSHDLLTVWALDDLDDISKSLLNILSFLDPDNITEVLFTQALGDRECGDCFADFDNYVDCRSKLLQDSLIRRNTANQQLMIHRIVQDVVRLRMDNPRSQLVFQRLVRLLFKAWPDVGPHEFGHLKPRWDSVHPIVIHIMNITKLYRSHKWDLGPAEQRQLAKILAKAGWYVDGFFA